MRRGTVGRTLVIVAAGAAVAVAALHSFLDEGSGSPTPPATVPSNAIRVPYSYSTNQDELLEPLIRRFNAEKHELDGRPIEIVGEAVSSGEAETAIARRDSRVTLWSPASSLWGRLLDYQVDAAWVPDENPALVRTPLVVAMWEPAARALGWPRKPIGFAQIVDLARSRAGWSAYGLPTFGRFKLGHTNPDFSTSGLSFVAAHYYTATGKIEGLTVDDVERADVRTHVRALEQSIVHYGDTSSFFVDQMKAHGAGYVSAVAMEEVTLLEYNESRPKGSMPLVAVYPAEGTFYFDNPLILLRAPWVTSAQARAAGLFRDWLLPRLTPELAARYGYRPSDPAARPVSPIDRAHRVDPAQPRRVLGLPDPSVLATIKRAWHEDRKPANVAIVVDTSGSMNDDAKLAHAVEGLRIFLRQFSPRDRVGLVTFAADVRPIVPIREMSVNRELLDTTVRRLTADGGTAVYDATDYGVRLVDELRDSTRINAVVVLTDGDDNRSSLDADGLEEKLAERSESEEDKIRVFTIAYGSDANKAVLHRIAAASGGLDFEGNPEEIEDVYTQISSYF
jgi:Ca-activated chloride channel family protein